MRTDHLDGSVKKKITKTNIYNLEKVSVSEEYSTASDLTTFQNLA